MSRRDELIQKLWLLMPPIEGYSHLTDTSRCQVADLILRREREMAEKIRDIFAQPPDRIIFPISKEDYTKFRDEALSTIDAILAYEEKEGKDVQEPKLG